MYIFQDCKFEIGKPIFVMCSAISIYGQTDKDYYPFRTDVGISKERDYKVKKSSVCEITFSEDDPCRATKILLNNNMRLYYAETYIIGHSVQEVRKRFEEYKRQMQK